MEIKVMTFNIRYDTKEDGVNSFNGRKELIKRFMDREMPDIVGFQEVLPHVRQWLCDNLDEYTVLGMGRQADYSGESVSIAYRKDKFDLVKFDQFWLSETPEVPGSRFVLDQSPCPRITVIATLVSRAEGKIFTFANTHLDHYGEYARVCGASFLMSKLAGNTGKTFFLTGDFNAFPDSAAIKTIKGVAGVKELTDGVPEDFATYHGYGKVKKNCKIDYIFTNEATSLKENSLKIHDDKDGDVWLSDHFPISVVAEIQ